MIVTLEFYVVKHFADVKEAAFYNWHVLHLP